MSKQCGMKTASGKPCVLDAGHDEHRPWQHREHKTVSGEFFTYMAERGKASRQFSGGTQNLVTIW